jgi:uroporphyrinogen decarboxylase
MAKVTSRERLLACLRREIPDCVPVEPDISNMVPCRLTGKPFWDIYVYEDPPLWRAHINALKHFDIDGGFALYSFGPIDVFDTTRTVPDWEDRIVKRLPDGSFVTQTYCKTSGTWSPQVLYHTADNPPAYGVSPDKFGLPPTPTEWEPIVGVKPWPAGLALWKLIREELGEQGVMGLHSGMTTAFLGSPADVYAYYDDPAPFRRRRDQMLVDVEQRLEKIAQMDPRPDYLICGGSGSLVFQTPAIVHDLVLPVLKRTTELAYDLGIPTHVHSCGPETELVRLAAEETKLTVIDPLEVPPMGDCDLADLKRRFGDRIVLKGNLHTTEVMLRGTPKDVVAASRRAIDDAARGGGFILSTGDQCGRDTPDANLRAMVETARTYGRY